MAEHDRVELVPVQHHHPAPVAGAVEGGAGDLHAAEVHARELAHHLVVFAGDIYDPRSRAWRA